MEISIHNGVEEISSNRVEYVESLFVDEGFRRNGVARELIYKGEEWILQNDCEQVIVDTEKSCVGACGFCSNCGFEEVLLRENTVFYKRKVRSHVFAWDTLPVRSLSRTAAPMKHGVVF